MRGKKYALLGLALLMFAGTTTAWATQYYGRQYYGSWSYKPAYNYYYRYYYYKPYTSYTSYNYHYSIYYPSRPRYVYYYNPYQKRYWGRFDLQGKKGSEYSLLAQKDRKEKLEDIPEKAFPKPGPMPTIPESKDKVQIKPLPKDLPTAPKKTK